MGAALQAELEGRLLRYIFPTKAPNTDRQHERACLTLKALEVYISPPPYLQLIPSNFPGAASFIYKLVGSTMFK